MLFAVIDSAQKRFDGAPLIALRIVTRNEFTTHGRQLLAFSSRLSAQVIGTAHVGTAALGCPAKQSSAVLLGRGTTRAHFADRESSYYKRLTGTKSELRVRTPGRGKQS